MRYDAEDLKARRLSEQAYNDHRKMVEKERSLSYENAYRNMGTTYSDYKWKELGR
jgi:hypothetical protein